MNRAQRLVLTLGAICVLHSSMVPPVSQADGELCRYHAFVERSLPFTRTYDAAGVDQPALFAEWGMIAALTGVIVLLLGFGSTTKP